MRQIFKEFFLAQVQKLEGIVVSGMRTENPYVDRALTEDEIIEMILAKCLQHIEDNNGLGKIKSMGILIGIKTRNVLAWYHRQGKKAKEKVKTERRFTEASNEPDACELLIQKETIKLVASFIDPVLAEAAMRHYEGESYKSIAADLQMKPATLRQQIHRMKLEAIARFDQILTTNLKTK